MMADNNKFPAYDKNLKANHFPLFGIATNEVVDNEKSTSMAHFLQVENLIKKIHKNYYDEQQTIFLDDKKFPYFYYQKNKQSKKFPISKEEIQKRPQKICNKFPLYVKKQDEEKKFPLVGKMYNDDINLNENMSTIFMCKIPQIITTTTIRKMANNNFDKQKFPLKNFQHANYKFQFPLNSKDKFMTPSILYVEEMIKIEERAEQDQVHMAMYNNNENNNEIQKFNEQQNKKIPKEKNVAINKHNNNNNNNIIVEEKQLEQTTKIIMLEAFSKNEQITTTTTTTIDEIEHFENNRGKQINEKSNNNNNNNNNNENLLNICYLINKQTETAKNVEKINFEFEKIFGETSSDVCEQSTQEDRPQFNIIFNNNNNNQQEEEEEKATKSNNEINLNLNVMGLTNFSHEGSVLSEKELLIDSSIDLGADMKHDQLNASNNENMPVQKHNYADLNKTSFTTYPRAKQTTDFARKYLPNLLDDHTSPTTTTTTNEPTCSSIRKSSTSVDVTSVLPERTLLRRQRRSLTQKSKSEQEEDPVERLNRLRARISGALCQVKGVLKQYSTDNVEEAAENCSSIPAAVPAKQEQEKSNETDNGPISFRFVRKIRRRSSFDERVVLEVPKESTEKEAKEEGSSENETKIETIQDRSEERIQPLTLDLMDEIKAKTLVGNEEKLNENETKVEKLDENETKNKKLDENETKLKENETRVNESETNIRKLEENETKVKKLNENEVKNKKLDQNETKFIENENTIKKRDKNDQNLKKLDDNETKVKKLNENEVKNKKHDGYETKLKENENTIKKLDENEKNLKKLAENEAKHHENDTKLNENITNIKKLNENETKVKKLEENETNIKKLNENKIIIKTLNKNDQNLKKLDKNEATHHENDTKLNENITNIKKLNENETKVKKLEENETNIKKLNENKIIIKTLNKNDQNLKKLDKNETKINESETKLNKLDENETKLNKNDQNLKKLDENETNHKKLGENETKLNENETKVNKLEENETKLNKLDENETKLNENETKIEQKEDLINETQNQQVNKDLTIQTNIENENVSKDTKETQKTKIKKRIFVVKTKSSNARRASVAAVVADHTDDISARDGAIRVHRRPSDSEAIIKKNNNLINNNNKTILNLGDTEKLLEIGYETLRGNETQQLHAAQHKNNNNNNTSTAVQVHSKVKQKAHDTPLAKTNEHVAATAAATVDIDIINNNNNQQHHHNKNVNNLQDEQDEQVKVEHNHKANKTDHIDNDMKLESNVANNAIDIEREQLKVTDHEQLLLSATIATDAIACNSFAKSTEHITPEISSAADIAMPELQSLPARVHLTSAVADVPPEDPPFNQLLIKQHENEIKRTNSIETKETVNAETQTPNLVKSKPRKVKKKVIIKRQQRRLSVSDTGFFREPVSEAGQANGAAVDVETLEKPIAYETDEESSLLAQTAEEEQEAAEPEPEPEPEPLRSCLKAREFQVGDWVMYAERYKKTLVRWKKGQVIERITSISYKLDIDGKEVPAHISYIKKYTDRKVNFGGKEYLEINYEQIEEEEEQARRYSIWNLV